MIARGTGRRRGPGLGVGNSTGSRGPAEVGRLLKGALAERRKDLCGIPVVHRRSLGGMVNNRHCSALAGPRQPSGVSG